MHRSTQQCQFEQSSLNALQPNVTSSSEVICPERSRNQLVLASLFTTKAAKGAGIRHAVFIRGNGPAGTGEAACVFGHMGAVGKVSR